MAKFTLASITEKRAFQPLLCAHPFRRTLQSNRNTPAIQPSATGIILGISDAAKIRTFFIDQLVLFTHFFHVFLVYLLI